MKLSGRETVLILFLLVAVLVVIYYFFLLSPAMDRREDSLLELNNVTNQKREMDSIIAANEGLRSQMSEYEDNIVELEQSLLPTINSEAIARRLQQKFEDNDMPFFVEIAADMPEKIISITPSNIVSINTIDKVRFNFTVSGSDGFFFTHIDDFEAISEPTHITFYEFLDVLKDIENDYPESVRLHSVTATDTGQGFMLFDISVDVYAYNLPSRLSRVNHNLPYVIWEGIPLDDIRFSGRVGILFEDIPPVDLLSDYARPYTSIVISPDMFPTFEIVSQDNEEDGD